MELKMIDKERLIRDMAERCNEWLNSESCVDRVACIASYIRLAVERSLADRQERFLGAIRAEVDKLVTLLTPPEVVTLPWPSIQEARERAERHQCAHERCDRVLGYKEMTGGALVKCKLGKGHAGPCVGE